MKTMIIEADMFIVPNASELMWSRALSTQNDHRNFLGLPELKLGDKVVQVWITSDESNNWQDHGIYLPGFEYTSKEEDLHKHRYESLWPRYFLASELKKLREGDTLTLELKNNVIIKLTAKQKNYRYRHFGNFEDVLIEIGA